VSDDDVEGPSVIVNNAGTIFSINASGEVFRRTGGGSWASEGNQVSGGQRYNAELVVDGLNNMYATAWRGKYNIRSSSGSWLGENTLASLSGKTVGYVNSDAGEDFGVVVWEESNSIGNNAEQGGGDGGNIVIATLPLTSAPAPTPTAPPLLEFPPNPEVSPTDPIPPATPLPPGPAGGLVPCGDPGEPDCNFCHLFALTNNIVVFFLLPDGSLNKNIPFVPVLAGLFIAIGGFFMLSAAASPQNAAKAKTIFFAVAIGLVIIYGAWLFINLVSDTFGAVSFGGEGLPWYKVNCALND
jgi:hypothetical protein